MAKSIATPNFAEYQTVREPAAELGVLQATLRNWDRSGKLKPLKIEKHQFRTVRGGFDAIEMASTFQPDMILIDVSMPNLNGYDAARQIRQSPKGRCIFIVAFTGCSQPEDVARSREAGCSAHLVKPVDVAALDDLMKRRDSAQN